MTEIHAGVHHRYQHALPGPTLPWPELPVPVEVEALPALERPQRAQPPEIRKGLAPAPLRPVSPVPGHEGVVDLGGRRRQRQIHAVQDVGLRVDDLGAGVEFCSQREDVAARLQFQHEDIPQGL